MAIEVNHMATTIQDTLVATALLALICLAGCGQRNTVYGVAPSSATWMSSTSNPVAGVDEASVTFVTLKAGPPDGVPFVVWFDSALEASGRGEGSVRGAFYEGHHRANHGPRVDFLAKTSDGKTGSITIAGVEYDFSKGSLFLISTLQDPPTVAQISLDLTGFPKGNAIKEFAKSNPQVRGFFEKHKKVDTNTK
jgi:hypothetical protein